MIAGFCFAILVAYVPGAARCPAATAGETPGWYSNPVLFADYSDPDVIRVGDDFYMVASSFHCVPGIPVLHSRDLVHWHILAHAVPSLVSPDFDLPEHGGGIWAPSIRFHDGLFWIYYGDPDRGIFMVRAREPAGPWDPPVLVREARGWIDPCPFWDDDGQAYLVHAWAKSRAGVNGILTIHRMSSDGRELLDDGTVLFDGRDRQPTIEGPKLYKRDGAYLVFAPAGGVTSGWQVVLRASSVLGPYQDRVVLAQGSTSINGPHQGAWVETTAGESWFLHFQDRGPFGRVVHLQPLKWIDGWPQVGADPDGDGIGEPVNRWPMPIGVAPGKTLALQMSDEFDDASLGLQWQWEANPRRGWATLIEHPGHLRLYAVPAPEGASRLWDFPQLLLQKLPGPSCTATVRMSLDRLLNGEETGLVILGRDYSALICARRAGGLVLEHAWCQDADRGGRERRAHQSPIRGSVMYLRVSVDSSGVCRYSASTDGAAFASVGEPVQTRKGIWVGARVGIYCSAPRGTAEKRGWAEMDWFRLQL